MTRSAKFLHDKTDAECRQLAGHYYRRAVKAEDREEATVKLLREAQQEINRLKGLAQDMIGYDE